MLKNCLNWLIVVLVAIPLGLECYLLYDGLASGTTSPVTRYGPHHTYSIDLDAGRFWFTMCGHLLTVIVLAGVLWVCIWLCRVDKPAGRR